MANNNKRKNYFSDNIQKFGENFLQQFDAKKQPGRAHCAPAGLSFALFGQAVPINDRTGSFCCACTR